MTVKSLSDADLIGELRNRGYLMVAFCSEDVKEMLKPEINADEWLENQRRYFEDQLSQEGYEVLTTYAQMDGVALES